MGYQILCDGNIIHDLRLFDDKQIVQNPKCTLEVNTVGTASFQIFPDHPHYGALRKMRSIFEILQDGEPIFRGRMTADTRDFDNTKDVELEGVLAFLNDSIVEPFSFPKDFLEDSDYTAAADSGNVIEFFLNWLIDGHNSQVENFQKLKLGNVTVTDPNNYLFRESSEYNSTWNIVKEKLFDSSLGGYLCIRYEADGNYIDYLEDFEFINSQPIEYGENLLDYSCESDSSATYSAIFPTGGKVEVQDGSDYEGDYVTIQNTAIKRLTLEDLTDGDLTSDLVKVGKIIYSRSALQQYGFICAPSSETTWDDVTTAENLRTKAIEYMTKTAIMLKNTITINAFDLHFSDCEIESFRIYGYVNLLSKPHDEDSSLKLTKLELDLQSPQNTVITLGEIRLSLTDVNAGIKKEADEKLQSFRVEINKVISESKSFVGVKNTAVFYYLSSSNTELVGGEWSETSPEWETGHFYWQKVVTTYTDNSTTESDPVCVSGENGKTGVGIQDVRPMFYLSTSKEEPTGGEWSVVVPTWSSGLYVWTRTVITYDDGSYQSTVPVCDTTWEAVNDASEQLEEKFNTQIKQLADSITLEVSGSLGSNANIILSAGENKYTKELDLSGIRKAFADDPTAISISAGTITFNSNTMIINSTNFQLSAAGKISADAGIIAGWTFDYNSFFSGPEFEASDAFICTGTNAALTIAGHTRSGWVFKAGNNFGVANDGSMYCTSAYLSGTMTTTNGDLKAVLTSGSLSLYYKDDLCGYFDTKYSEYAGERGIAIRLGEIGKYLAFCTPRSDVPNGMELDYYLNNGFSSLYTEKHQFQTSARFGADVHFGSSVYCLGLYMNETYFIKSYTSSGGVGEEMLGFRDSTLYVGSNYAKTILRGSTVYLKNTSTTVTSDRNAKNSIEALPEAYEAFMDHLSPVRFKFNEGTSGRYHVGYIAQDVEAALTAAGLTSLDFAGYVNIDFSGELGLSYDEFIAALHLKIKRLESRISELEKWSVAA